MSTPTVTPSVELASDNPSEGGPSSGQGNGQSGADWTKLSTAPGCSGASDAPVLVVTANAPISQALLGGVELTYLPMADGARLRCAQWQHPNSIGTVVIMTGYAEFIEKYYEVIGELYSRNYSVVSFDWRGQGLSTRAHPQRCGWVENYDQLISDFLNLIRALQLPQWTGPLIGLGHSMGGHLAVKLAQEQDKTLDGIVVTAPMMGLVSPKTSLMRLLAGLGNGLGLGQRSLPGSGEIDPFGPHIPLSADPARIETWRGYQRAEPYLITHGATWRWAREAAASMHRLNRTQTRLNRTQTSTNAHTPLLIINPLADTLVSPAATQQYAAHCPSATLVDIPGAGHEILQEAEPLRGQFWAEFDRFTNQLT